MKSVESPGQDTDRRQRRRQQLEELSETLTLRMRALWNPTEWSEVELTMPQFRALDLLVKEPLRMSEIAAALGTSLQATTSLIDRLVDKGLVERGHDVADRRVVICHLTPAGQTEMHRFFRMGQARLDLLIDLLTDEELDTVISAFVTLAEAALRRQEAAAATGSTPDRPNEKEKHES
ncbi:MAG TPA: MarR family transcriptional regulator [Thermomicrobiales bacterium]|nr:MarR family transcriptional regulator [Thermomicrobiales bacterium]